MRWTHLSAALAAAALLTLTACTEGTSPAAAPSPDIQSVLDTRRDAYGAPGALALLARGDSQWFASSGTADTAGTPITEATRFRIASITKPIVATLVLDAVARGEVALDDVVGDLLPGTVREDPPITVRQLLDHTSGIFDITNEQTTAEALQADIERLPDEELRAEAQAGLDGFLAGQRVIAPARVLVALSEVHDRYFPPGSGYHYSNTGYQLAGMVLEEATGTPLAELLEERIVEPLGLQRTTLAPPDTASPELRGYGTSTEDGSLVDMTDDLLAFGNGANGGIISTADELLATIRAIVGGQLLPADLTAQMKEPNRESYGLGPGDLHPLVRDLLRSRGRRERHRLDRDGLPRRHRRGGHRAQPAQRGGPPAARTRRPAPLQQPVGQAPASRTRSDQAGQDRCELLLERRPRLGRPHRARQVDPLEWQAGQDLSLESLPVGQVGLECPGADSPRARAHGVSAVYASTAFRHSGRPSGSSRSRPTASSAAMGSTGTSRSRTGRHRATDSTSRRRSTVRASALRSANSTSSTRVFCRNAPSNTTTSATPALPSDAPNSAHRAARMSTNVTAGMVPLNGSRPCIAACTSGHCPPHRSASTLV